MKFKLFICLVLIAACIFSGCAKKFYLKKDKEYPTTGWNFVRKNTQSTAAMESDFKGQLNLKWENKVSENQCGPLSAAGGNLVFCGTKGRVYFFDLETGAYMGRYKAKRGIQTGLTTIDSLAYLGVGPKRDEFICLNLHNQKKLWSLDLKDVTGAPIIIQDKLFIGSAKGRVFCLNRFGGNVIWQDSVKARTLAGPSGDDKTVYFPFDDGILRGYEVMKGELIFESNLNQPLVSKVVVGKRIYVTGADGGLFALVKGSGKVIWKKEFSDPIWASPALDGDLLFVGDNGGNLRALRVSDGDICWEFKCNGVILSAPIVVGDFVLFGSLDRSLYCLEKKTGRLVSKRDFKSGLYFPAIGDNGIVCIAAHNGTIQCFGD
jgi:outer membrane protein assembly factor BamB